MNSAIALENARECKKKYHAKRRKESPWVRSHDNAKQRCTDRNHNIEIGMEQNSGARKDGEDQHTTSEEERRIILKIIAMYILQIEIHIVK